MLKENWHTHTKRCGHATGEDEEYVQAAIQGGLKILGFSDHAAYADPAPGERMNIEQVPDYMNSIHALQQKYAKDIQIYLGMEVEYYPTQWEILSDWRRQLDYCILGQHELDYFGKSSYDLREPKDLELYTDAIEKACSRNLVDYICHPDVCLWSYPVLDDSVRQIAARIARIANTYDVPVELNCGSGVARGMRLYEDGERYAYPTRIFFEEFAKAQCRVVIGLDVHNPKLFLTDKYIDRALSVIEGLDCRIVDHIDLPAEAKKRKELFQ